MHIYYIYYTIAYILRENVMEQLYATIQFSLTAIKPLLINSSYNNRVFLRNHAMTAERQGRIASCQFREK
jgi:hypothetical protein